MRINPINGMKKASSPMNGTHAHPQIIEIKHLKVDGRIKAIRYTLTITHIGVRAYIAFNMHKYGNNLGENGAQATFAILNP